MDANLKEDKFIIISEAFTLGNYDTVIQESCKIFESIMKKLFIEASAKFNYEDRKILMEAEGKIGKGNVGIEKFTFGETIGLYRTCDFFQRWAKHTDRDFSILEGINFNTINKLRNYSAHEDVTKVIRREEADYIFSSLKLFLATLGYTEFDKYISNSFDITSNNNSISKNKFTPNITSERTKNSYDVVNAKEKKRLKSQSEKNREYDLNILNNLLNDKRNINILDIGCNNGESIIERFGSKDGLSKIVGIDINEQIIEEAKTKYINEKYSFHCVDCESESFLEEMIGIMEDQNIEQFDLINLSLILLHIKKPYKLLKEIRELLGKGCVLYIRDPDDGMEFAYPDPSGIVEKMLAIRDYCEFTGYRKCGRELYTLLKRTGYKNIAIYYHLKDTINKNYDERESIFMNNFSYIPGDLQLMIKKYPTISKYREDSKWLDQAYEELEELFHMDDFYYQFCTIIFTAQK